MASRCAGLTVSGRRCRRKPRKGKPVCGVCKGPSPEPEPPCLPVPRAVTPWVDIERLRLSDGDAGLGQHICEQISDSSWWPGELCDAMTESGETIEEANRLIAADPDSLTPGEHVTLADVRDRAAQHVLNLSEAAEFSHDHKKRLQEIADGCYSPIFEYPALKQSALDAWYSCYTDPADRGEYAPYLDNKPWSDAVKNIDRLLFGCGPYAESAASALHNSQTVFCPYVVDEFYEQVNAGYFDSWEYDL